MTTSNNFVKIQTLVAAPAQAATPNSEFLITINYAISYQGQELDSTCKRGQVFEFFAGDGTCKILYNF